MPVTQSPDLERLLVAAQSLPHQILPLYNYLESIEPDALFICDRDARPIGAALAAIRERTGGLLSIGDSWYDRRISTRISTAALTAHLAEPLTTTSSKAARPVIAVVDDYVSKKASTCGAFREVCTDLGVNADIRWVTLSGKGTAFNAYPFAGAAAMAPWRDRPEVLGIEYDGVRLLEQPTELSELFYATIRKAVSQLDLSPLAGR